MFIFNVTWVWKLSPCVIEILSFFISFYKLLDENKDHQKMEFSLFLKHFAHMILNEQTEDLWLYNVVLFTQSCQTITYT